MSKRKFFKKTLAIILSLAMLAPIMGYLRTNMNEVKAEETVEKVGYVAVPKAAVTVTPATEEGKSPVMTVNSAYDSGKYAEYADYIFAGWYTDETVATAYKASETISDSAYARFVPADVLSVKCQVTKGPVTETEIEKYQDKYVMRFVSSVDSLDYSSVGFELKYEDENGNPVTKTTSNIYTVYKHISSTTGLVDDEEDTYSFSSKIMDTKSEYFITAKLPIENTEAALATEYTVRAFWKTQDGTTVYGAPRCVSANDGFATDYVNMSFENTEGVNLTNVTSLKANASNATVIDVDGTTVHVKVPVSKSSLASATKFNFTLSNGTAVGSTIYRNLYTEYAGTTSTADISWYDAYADKNGKVSETEFIIATDADLYGLAKKTNAGVNFSGKTIYLVADIAANEGQLITDRTSKYYMKWYDSETDTYAAKPKTGFNWTEIGNTDGRAFAGTLDGDMHTISGIYQSREGAKGGLFGAATTGSNIQNLKMTNSYFYTTNRRMGSIVGYLIGGTIDNVYSNALIVSNANTTYADVGGLIGQGGTSGQNKISLNRCWFDGAVVNKSTKATCTGGLIATANAETTDITNCLNTGVIDVSNSTQVVTCAAGLVGVNWNGTLTMKNSMHHASVIESTGYMAYTINGFNKGTMNLENVYYGGHTRIYRTKDADNVSTGTFSGNYIKMANSTDYSKTLLSTGEWVDVSYSTPVPKDFESVMVDTSWYHENKGVFTLYDKGDLYGFAKLSQEVDFKGKTVKLGADIVVNNKVVDKLASDTDTLTYDWTPIGTSSVPFAGTFEGNMYTISGIHLNTEAEHAGLFKETANSSVIQNFKLTNSYFRSTDRRLGSIAGCLKGSLNNVYSNAVVVSNVTREGRTADVGGLVGVTGNSTANITVNIKGCWFDGTVTNESTTAGRTGGLVASAAAVTTNIINCLNTGKVDISKTTLNPTYAAGLVGTNLRGSLTIENSMHNANISKGSATAYCILGSTANDTTLKLENVYYYGLNQSFKTNANATGGTAAEQKDEYIKMANNTNYSSTLLSTDEWVAVSSVHPVPKHFESVMVDTRWYDTDESTYVLQDRADLYGFAKLSQTNDFAEKTVKLGADIIVNEGDAAQLANDPSTYKWAPIGTSDVPFAGTFDGDMHTISGVYLNTTARNGGLFTKTGETSIVQKLKLTDSYFNVGNMNCGSIAGVAQGKFYMIYSDATVICSNAHVGGFAGLANGSDMVMENCWFDGSVTNTSTEKQYTGGLVGRINDNGVLSLKNCLNTATIDVTAYTRISDGGSIGPYVGGLVGGMKQDGTTEKVNIHACLNTGKIRYIDSTENKVIGYGPIVGFTADRAAVVISSTYATAESCAVSDLNHFTATYDTVSENDIKGDAAKTAMPLLGWDEDWECVENDFPAIIFLATGFGEGAYNVASDSDTALLSALYGGRTLYQGEAHDHAMNGGTSDGTVTLAAWKEQMLPENNDMDFAASLDHQQTWHINHADWDKNKFIYGTEALAWFTDMTATKEDGSTGNADFHYDMIFAGDNAQSSLQNVLKAYPTKFNYNAAKDNVNSSIAQSISAFKYGAWTRSEFKNLIQTVKDQGGFFALAHPLMYYPTVGAGKDGEVADIAENVLDYYFADYIGMHVICGTYTASYTKACYKMWTELLAKGKRVWATAGGDGHENLSTKALTSIYAKKESGENYLSEAYVRNMKQGAFTAGSVGIQMCIGDTQMGGHRDFNGQRLVVGIPSGAFHKTAIVEDCKYRVEILNEDGVVYSKEISNDTDTYIAFDADENSAFYRVDVMNATTGQRIAIGNPIWND